MYEIPVAYFILSWFSDLKNAQFTSSCGPNDFLTRFNIEPLTDDKYSEKRKRATVWTLKYIYIYIYSIRFKYFQCHIKIAPLKSFFIFIFANRLMKVARNVILHRWNSTPCSYDQQMKDKQCFMNAPSASKCAAFR